MPLLAQTCAPHGDTVPTTRDSLRRTVQRRPFVPVDLCCASKTPSRATLKQPSLMLPAGRTLLLIESPGGTVSKQEPWELRKTEEFRQHWRERRESSVRPPRAPHQPTSAPTAWGTATPGLGFTAMQDPAPPILCANPLPLRDVDADDDMIHKPEKALSFQLLLQPLEGHLWPQMALVPCLLSCSSVLVPPS